METGSKGDGVAEMRGNEVPYERPRPIAAIELTDATTSELSLSPLGGSAFDHQPQAVEIDPEAENPDTGNEQHGMPRMPLGWLVKNTLQRAEELTAEHDQALGVAEGARAQIRALTRRAERAEDTAANAQVQLKNALMHGRRAAWQSMAKNERGHASDFHAAAQLSPPGDRFESPADNRQRMQIAIAENDRIKPGQAATIRYNNNGVADYEAGTPRHVPGFVVGIDTSSTAAPFMVGLTEPRIPIDQLWADKGTYRDGAINRSYLLQQGVMVRPFLERECEQYIDHARQILQGPAHDSNPASRAERIRAGVYLEMNVVDYNNAGQAAVNAIVAYRNVYGDERAASDRLFKHLEPADRTVRCNQLTELVTDHLLFTANGNDPNKDVLIAKAADALREVHSIAGDTDQEAHVADHIITSSRGRIEGGQLNHNQEPILHLLVTSFGMDAQVAAQRLGARTPDV